MVSRSLIALWLSGCGAAAPALPPVPAQLEAPEGTGAWLVPLDGSPAVMVYRWQLPPDAREGDVIVDGRVDREQTARHHRELTRQLIEIEKKAHGETGGRR